MNQFRILAPSPVITHVASNATSFDEVFPRSVGENTPGAHLIWNGIAIRLHYSYDAYRNAVNIADLVRNISSKNSGKEEISLMTDMLFVEWKIQWQQVVTIQANFLSRKAAWNHYAAILNQHAELQVSKSTFVREWQNWLQALNQIAESTHSNDFPEEQNSLTEAIQKTVV